MKQTAVEWLFKNIWTNPPENLLEILDKAKEMQQQQQGYSEEEMLKMLHKFGFDYTYNYRGEKTIYEWIPEWFEEYKRLEQFKNK